MPQNVGSRRIRMSQFRQPHADGSQQTRLNAMSNLDPISADLPSLALTRLAAESAGVALWTVDPVSRAAWWSDLFFKILGYEPDGIGRTSKAFRKLIHPEDRPDAIASMEALVAGDAETYKAVFRLRTKSGEWRWYEASARMGKSASGTPLICGGLKDVHEDRLARLERERLLEVARSASVEIQRSFEAAEEAREKAETSEDMLKLAVEFGDHAAWSNCRDTGEAWLMDAGYRMLGYSREEFDATGDSWQEITHPDDRAGSQDKVAALFSGRTDTFDHVQRLRHGDGSYHWYRVMARLKDRSEQGLPPLLTGMLTNVDALKAGETRLSEALHNAETLRADAKAREEMLRMSLAAGGQMVWTLGPEDKDCTLTEEGYGILGYTPETFIPNRNGWRGITHPEDAERAFAEMERLRDGEIDLFEDQHRLRHGDGTYHWYRVVARIIDRGARDMPPLIAGTSIRIDALKENEERLNQALDLAERLRAEAKASEEMLRTSVSSGEQTAWSACAETGEAWMMDEGFRMLGYEPGEFVPDSAGWRSLFHPDDLPAAIEEMTAFLNGERQLYRFDNRYRHKDGSYHWYSVIARMIDRSDQGLPPLMAGTTVRIDALKEKEARLSEALGLAERLRAEAKASEELLRLAMGFGGQAAWSACEETGEAFLMDEGYRMLGYDRSEWVPNSDGWRSIIHPDDLDGAIARVVALFSGESDTYESIHRMRHKDGQYHWYRVMSRLQDRSAQDLPPLMAGMIIAFDDVKAIELRLSEAVTLSERLRAEAKAREDMLSISLSAGEQLAWNLCSESGEAWLAEEGYEVLGYTPEEFTPDDAGWRGIFHPDDLPAAVAAMERLVSGQSDTYKNEQRLRHKDGSYQWYRGVAAMIDRSDLAMPPLVAGTMVCIDDEKRREADLSNALADAESARTEAQQTAEILRVSSENSGVVPWFNIPDEGRSWSGSNIAELLGIEEGVAEDVEGWAARIHPDDLPRIGLSLRKVSDGVTDDFSEDFRIRRGDDSYIWCRSVGRRIRRTAQGLPDMICGAQFSIDELKKNEARQAEAARELQEANTRITRITDNAPAGIFEYRRYRDGSFDFPYFSGRFCEIMGLTQEEIEASPAGPFERVHEEDLARVITSVDASEQKMSTWRERFRVVHPERGTVWISGSSTPKKLDDGAVSWIGALTDVTDDVTRETALKEAHRFAERMRQENERLAMHDVLTGLPNRRYFDQLFQSRLYRAERDGPRDLCLIRVDLDKFKYINDTLGHEAGDEALRHVAQTMKSCVRDGDFVGRIGGDEFSILMAPGSDERAAESLVNRMRCRLEKPVNFGGRNLHVRASFGVAHAENILDHGRDLQFFADKALYTAKDSGRNQVQFFTTDLYRGILDNRELGADLQEALNTDQFVPYFQPQVSAQTGELLGVETLLRWQHPTRGLLTPDKFMPLAEQMRIMPEIDRQTFRTALELVSDWEASGLEVPKISFNISSGRMRDTAILEDIEQWYRSRAGKITFELLESILVENESAEFNSNLAEVRERGIDIEIDDFGSGHASIISIMAIQPSAIKIDRRLVQPIGQDPKYLDVIRGIVDIADTLGITTIAEGVETEEQARDLEKVGCDVLQGYLFARPLSPEDFLAYLSKGRRGDSACNPPKKSA
ncbi:PAS domain-containing protein [Ovoidimarina sediminis]|uniref:PAS domain-containing protein n=1 Tax=Ovoidimarina sediminis TaxID=3079856 RepID=UPI002912F7B4|nr:PAS domain-containing protein [Rhodophyticola sp. MJ-SS7]MDU8944082.1 PAS domain-containing protein [Rhodophyticola sp. MJ-SS7]